VNGVSKLHDPAAAFPLRRVVITNRKTANAVGRIDPGVVRILILDSTGDADKKACNGAGAFTDRHDMPHQLRIVRLNRRVECGI